LRVDAPLESGLRVVGPPCQSSYVGDHGRWGKRMAMALALLLAGGLLALAQVVATLSQWYGWSLPWLANLDWLAQACPYLGNLGFGRYLPVVLAAALVGGLVGAASSFRLRQSVLADPPSRATVAQRSRIPMAAALLLVAAVGLEAVAVWRALEGGLPPAALWCLPPILVASALKLWERSGQRPPLLVLGDWLYLLAYHCAIAGCACAGGRAWIPAVILWLMAGAALYASVADPSPRPGGMWGGASRAIVLALGLGYFALAAWDLNSWRFAVIGDEYSFFLYAWQLLKGVLSKPLLTGLGNYGMHPAFSSYLQAASMRLWGIDNYGWRISNVLVVASALPFWYMLVRSIATERVALLATGFLACSHYLIGFGKIGYNNLQALWPVCVSVAFLFLAMRKDSLLGYWLAGTVAGLGFYVFALARLAAPALGLLMLLYRSPFRRRNWLPWAALLLGIGVTAWPIIAEPGGSEVLWQQTVFGDTGIGAIDEIARRVGSNSLRALFSFLISRKNTHFVYGAHLDPLTGSLAVAGLFGLFMGWRKVKAPWVVLLGYGACILALGGLAQYDYPPNTRLFALVPLYALMAAVGCDGLARTLARVVGWPKLAVLLSALCVGAAFGVNAYIVYDRLPAGRAITQESVLVRMLQEMESGQAPLRPVYVVRAEGDQYDLVRYLMSAFGLERVSVRVLAPQEAVEALRQGGFANTPAVVLIPSQFAEGASAVVAAAREAFPGSEVVRVVDRSGAYHFEQIVAPVAIPETVGIRLEPWAP